MVKLTILYSDRSTKLFQTPPDSHSPPAVTSASTMASPVGGSGHHTEATFWQQYTATLNRNILRKKRTMKTTLTVC
jgi:hypothetical protein